MEKHHKYYTDKDGQKVDLGYDGIYDQDEFYLYHHKRLEDEKETSGRLQRKAKNMAMVRNSKATQFSLSRAKEQDLIDDIPVDGNSKNGSFTFMKFCSSCHMLTADSTGQKLNGPSLGLIYGRLAGADRGYLNYSSVMVQSRKLWSMGPLMKMMKEPDDLIPGMKCGLTKAHINKQDEQGVRRLDSFNAR